MFRLLRRMAIAGSLLILAVVTYFLLRDPGTRRGLFQTAEEVKEGIQQGSRKYPWTGTAVVVAALEGDRAKVDTESNRGVIVRLAGIDAPELGKDNVRKGQPLAEESRRYLDELIKGKAVEMAIIGTDLAKQPLVLLTCSNLFVNARMVHAGFAEATSDDAERIPAKLRHAMANAELAAKQSRLGIWGLTNYVRPVEYRIRHRS